MVATRLYEVTTKGTEWAYGRSSGRESPRPEAASIGSGMRSDPRPLSPFRPPPPRAQPPTALEGYWKYANNSLQYAAETTYSTLASFLSSIYCYNHDHSSRQRRQSLLGTVEPPLDDSSMREKRKTPFTKHLKTTDLVMIFKNPYDSVRGRHERPSSMSAVRSLLTLMPETTPSNRLQTPTLDTISPNDVLYEGLDNYDPEASFVLGKVRRKPFTVTPSETASQIAEGTLRALRDLALDEAVDLHIALRFWTERWERPILSWLEAGPEIWTSYEGYNHQLIGKKVAQIQTVLARRCAAIGELQQHLLRAGWQRGVAQWGVLGQGAQWAAIAGFDGATVDDMSLHPAKALRSHLPSDLESGQPVLENQHLQNQGDEEAELPAPPQLPRIIPPPAQRVTRQESAAVFVKKEGDGGIFVDDPAFLTEWSVEAIALVRRHLWRSSNGVIPLPFESNWRRDDSFHGDDIGFLITEGEDAIALPVWVRETIVGSRIDGSDMSTASVDTQTRQGLVVTNLDLMVEEVSELLNTMEDIMDLQRRRRLEVMRPPSWLRRNWYMVVGIVPPTAYVVYRLLRQGAKDMFKLAIQKISIFFNERVREPVVAIFNEIVKGRESFSDKEARMEAIESLKKMIRSWLDDTFPLMSEEKRIELSEAMDVTLLEQKKVEAMKTFFEINNVIRMSFIEMQYMKKELLNALSAIDEMMSANDINMNLAAITPVAMLAYVGMRVFKFMFHSMLKLGKSREETYASFRNILTDINRLLVMRDNPPNPSPRQATSIEARRAAIASETTTPPPVLGPDDLGMLMLLIHECRSILWRDRRRFSSVAARNVSEDLAELAGERGAVSVRQQLQIVERMSRTYSFLRTGHTVGL